VITTQPKYVWYRDLDRYQWFVVAIASVGWMFDTMAQQLFNLARVPALRDLMGGNASAAAVSEQAGDATMIFMIGWAPQFDCRNAAGFSRRGRAAGHWFL